jgi:hypothetical protein
MYLPWQPVEGRHLDAPDLDISCSGTGVRIEWHSLAGTGPSFEIVFQRGLAGLLIVDESSYMSSDLGLPVPSQFADAAAPRLPWPAWYESESPRMALYGDLGRLIYTQITSYYLVGGDVALLLDIADCEPAIKLLRG